ncbi:MAG: hypothetical protein WC444_06440 [Candidatus Paceibacterota bacterium]
MSLLIGDFKQGWQNKARHELMHDDSVYVGKNVNFDNTGAVRCRERHAVHTPYFNSQLTVGVISNLFQINVEGIDKQLIFHSGSTGTSRWNSLTNVTTSISSSLTSARHISYAAVKPEISTYTYVYMTDGVTMIADNGTSTKTWGIDAPESAPLVSIDSATGQLSAGAYSYVYTFYDGATGAESEPSPACASITVTDDQSVMVANLTVSNDSRITARRLYRTIADGGTRYLIAIIPDNVVTYYVDTIPDSNLTQVAVTDAGIPPTCDVVMALKNVLFLTGDTNYRNRVYNCIADQPDSWPSTYYVEAGQAGTVVQNLAIAEGKLYIVTQHSVVGLSGYTEYPDTFTTDETKATVGTYARWSVASVGGGIYYLARDGVYMFDGVKSTCVSTPIEKAFWQSPTSLYSVVDRDQAPSKCRATCYNGRYYLIAPMKDTTGTSANNLLEFNPVEKQWRLITTRLDDIFGDDANGVLYGSTDYQFSTSSGNSTVYQLLSGDVGTTDESISVEVVTKNYDFTSAPEDLVKSPEVAYGVKAKRVTETSWLKEYRVDADGSWTLEFFVDGVSRYSVTLTSLTHADAYNWRSFESKIKGRFVYVKATNTNAGPTSHELREIEVR